MSETGEGSSTPLQEGSGHRATSGLALRLLAEFAIIFVGVVLAFQFENWREERQDREREAEALEALAADFRANETNLRRTLRSQERTADGLGLWIRAAAGEDPGISVDSLAQTFGFAMSWYKEELVSGAWDGLTSSGDVGLLRDRALRSRISEFYGMVDSGFEDHDNEMDLLFEIQSVTRVPAGPLLAPEGQRFRSDGVRQIEDPAEHVAAVLNVPGFHGLLAWKATMTRNRLRRLQWLQSQTDTILMQLDGGRSDS